MTWCDTLSAVRAGDKLLQSSACLTGLLVLRHGSERRCRKAACAEIINKSMLLLLRYWRSDLAPRCKHDNVLPRARAELNHVFVSQL